MGKLFDRKVKTNGSIRTTKTTNRRTGKVSFKTTRITKPKKQKK
jgi:hypothetical protein